MNRQHSDLLTLLNLLAGKLSPEEGQIARRRMDDDPKFRQRYRQVSGVWTERESIGDAASPRDPLPAELTAGFLDGGLSARDVDRVEAACWGSDAALRHVVGTYRVVLDAGTAQDVPTGLSDRLLQLHPDAADRHAGPVTHPVETAVVNGSLPPRVSRRNRPRPADRSARKIAWIAGALLLVLTGGIALLLMNRPDRGGDPGLAQPESPAPVTPDSPDDVAPPGPDSTPERPQPDTPLATVDTLPDAPHDPAPRPETADPGSGTPVATAGTTLTWTRIFGLLAVRRDGVSPWRGSPTEWDTKSPAELALLPGSRAEGEFTGGVRLLLDGDSRMALTPGPQSAGLPRLALEWGRLGLFDLGAGTPLPLTVADQTFQVERDGTAVALEHSGAGGRLFVIAGALSHESRRLGPGDSLEWNGADGALTSSTTVPPEWLDNGTGIAAVDRQTISQLVASDDLARDLETTMASATAADVDAVASWTFALSPESAVSSLNADSRNARLAALNWLAEAPAEDSRRATAWRAFAGSLDDAETARQVVGWFRAVHDPARADRQLFSELLDGLAHADLSVRETADFCLQRITGTRVAAYRADAAPAERRQGALRWRNVIARMVGGGNRENQPRGRGR